MTDNHLQFYSLQRIGVFKINNVFYTTLIPDKQTINTILVRFECYFITKVVRLCKLN